jgi:hypothetical protein
MAASSADIPSRTAGHAWKRVLETLVSILLTDLSRRLASIFLRVGILAGIFGRLADADLGTGFRLYFCPDPAQVTQRPVV